MIGAALPWVILGLVARIVVAITIEDALFGPQDQDHVA